ncbi:MAG: DNA repair protein RecO [Desulfobulbaceae bacterium]|nr:DNA repair protein RecO [Desulfobulbaceae bacterium]
MGELVLRFTREHDAEPELFSLLHWALASLNAGTSPKRIAALFHLRFLDTTGYRPALNGCGICNFPVSVKRSFALHPGSGGLICNRCRQKDPVFQPGLSVQTLKFLQNAQWLDLQRLHRLQLPAKAADETLKALYHYTRHLLQQDIHSWKFIRL